MPAEPDKPKTLRDEFAMAAMPALLPTNASDYAQAAAMAYAAADAMLKERAKVKP